MRRMPEVHIGILSLGEESGSRLRAKAHSCDETVQSHRMSGAPEVWVVVRMGHPPRNLLQEKLRYP
jgi:hypothetical protein